MTRGIFETVRMGRGRSQGAWTNYDVEDGLPTLRICDIMQDREGFLWFATQGAGVVRYDGSTLAVLNRRSGLPSDEVNAVFQDQSGHLWFATREGAVRSDGGDLEIYTVEDGLPDNRVHRICQGPEGDWWIGTGKGVSRFDGRRFAAVEVEGGKKCDWVCPLGQDPEELWLGAGDGLYRLDRQDMAFVTRYDAKFMLTGCRDRQGRVWLGGLGGAVRLDGDSVADVSEMEGLGPNNVPVIFRDSRGHLWLAVYGKGVYRFDEQGLTSFSTQDGLASAWVNGAYEDADGHFWFVTEGGVSRYSPDSMAVWGEADGLADNGVMVFAKDAARRLWVGTWRGISRYEEGEFHTLEATRHLNVWDLVPERDGNMVYGSLSHGIGHIKGEALSEYQTAGQLANRLVYAVCRDREGLLWVGTNRGLGCYGGGRLRFYTAADGLGADSVRAILQDRQGVLWFGTYGGGLCRYDGNAFAVYDTADGLCDNAVLSLYEDRQGGLWIGTLGGLSRFDGQCFTNLTVEDGLCYNAVLSLYEDRRGILWIGTHGGGISRYDGRLFQTIGRRSGLPDNTIQQIGEDDDGVFWIATEGGLVRYREQRTPPTLRLGPLVADQTHEGMDDIAVPDSHKWVRVRLEANSFTTYAGDMAYLCTLDGASCATQVVREGYVEYRDLPVGRYNLRVQAVDKDLNYSAEASLSFEVVIDPLVQALKQALGEDQNQAFITQSPAAAQSQSAIQEVAPLEVTVLITGETGCGKGVAARSIHRLSPRRDKSFVQVNCGALPDGLVESELFGHERGAFTGADGRKVGKVEMAHGGTLFLDEIGDLPLAAQVKILHLLQENSFERVGGTQTLAAQVRLVAATNRDLKQMVEKGTFRQDLYFRLCVFPLQLPPLRQRREDIPLLAAYFLNKMGQHLGKKGRSFSTEAQRAMLAYDWPGNVRELENAVQRALIVCKSDTIQTGDLLIAHEPHDPDLSSGALTLAEHERHHIQRTLAEEGTVRKAAAVLGVPPSTLQGKMKKLGIVKSE